MTIDQFTKTSAPITVIVNISNPAAVKLARILVEQGSKLLIVDRLNSAKRKILNDLITRQDCLFMDAESTFKNIEKFKKIDYVYYFLSQLSTGSMYPELFGESMEIVQLTHKEFLRESNRVDAYIKLSAEFDASFTLVTSAYVGQFLEPIPEANLQLQKYAESLVLDYVDRNRLNGRIVRLGELIGKEADLSSPTNTARLARELLLRQKINIFGDGLQQNYLVHTEDAVYAILKAAFASQAKGRTYLIAYAHPFTSLSIAYQLLELTTEEKEVVFNEVLPRYEEVVRLKDMCIAPSATALGWEPQISFDQALAETIQYLATSLKHPWTSIERPTVTVETKEQGVKEDSALVIEQSKPIIVQQRPRSNPVGEALSSFLERLYQTAIAQPLLWLMTLPKQLSARYAKSAETYKQATLKTVIATVIFIIVAFVVTPYIHSAYSVWRLFSIAQSLKRDVSELNSQHFEEYASKIPVYIQGIKEDIDAVSYLSAIPPFASSYTQAKQLITAYSSYGMSISRALTAGAPALEIAKGLSNATPNNPSGTVSRDYFAEIEEIMAQQQQFTQAVQDAKIGALQMQRVSITQLPSFVQSSVKEANQLLQEYTTIAEQSAQFYDLIPYFLGYKDRRTYFLMVQNETELRATGGWFTNYVIIGVENGQVRQFSISDVYDTDGKIDGITAPVDMQKALQTQTMKVATSNWNPELRIVSKNLSDVLREAGVYKPNDITITVNFGVVQDILKIVGPVTVDGLGEVTAENLHEKVGTLHTQFVPGSQEKTKTVTQFFPKFTDAIMASSAVQKSSMISSLLSSLKKHDIMVYSTDLAVRNRLLTPNNTYTEIRPVDHPLFVVDWNKGGNKANMFTKRLTEVEINEETKKVTYVMTYTNDSKTNQYPEGKYVATQRMYYPQEFAFASASGYNASPLLFTTDQGAPYLMGELSVDTTATKIVTHHFVLRSLPNKLTLLKQSGQVSEIVRVTFIPAKTSKLSFDRLRQQEFSETSGKWVKTYVHNSDVVIDLQ